MWSDSPSTSSRSSETSSVYLGCFPPLVTLIPSSSTLSFPLQFRRSQDFFFSSTIELQCNISLSIQLRWSINNCSSSNCSNPFPLDPTRLLSTSNEFSIPGRTLPFGLYEVKFTVSLNLSSSLSPTKSAFVRITPLGITANLVPLGTSMISSGWGEDLQLNPGLYSIDLDEIQFNASDWNYQYFCRISGQSNFPNLFGSLLSIDDPRVDPLNPSCLNNRSGRVVDLLLFDLFLCSRFEVNGSSSLSWRFSGVPRSLKSSLILLGGSLRANVTFQWMLQIENKRNNSLQGTGYLLLRVEQTSPQLIAIGSRKLLHG